VVLLLNVMRQNHPALARLVPGHLARLRQTLGATWLVSTLLFAGALALGAPPRAPGAGLAFGAALMAVALLLRWPLASTWVWLIPASSGVWSRWQVVHELQAWLAWAMERHAPGLALLLLAGMALALLAVVQSGGPAHVRSHRQRERWAEAARGGMPSRDLRPGWRLFGWVAAAPYAAWLRRLCDDRRRSPAISRAMLALGPQLHWSSHLAIGVLSAGIATLVLGVVLPLVAPGWAGPDGAVAAWGLSFGLMMFALNPVLQARSVFHHTRHEQALLALAPGMPRGVRLNRALAMRQALHALSAWVVAAVCSLWLVHASDSWQPLAFAFGCLPVLCVGWRDWSRAGPVVPLAVALPPLVAGALGATASLALQHGLSLWWVAGLSLLATGAAMAWRWRRIQRAPAAWPTGRLAA
jgi:hypothetical protein